MQLKNLTLTNGKFYLLLLVVAFLTYWPLSFHIFSLKNDALSYFLPFRYHISMTIQHGYFPFWSPYLYTGLPLHADIQSGTWNPVVLLISIFTTYDMNVLQAETLFYLVMGGFGFFKLCRAFDFEKTICLALSVSYMCCGFMIDSTSFIPWITSAAWLPLMFLYFIRLLSAPDYQNALKLSLTTSLVFLSGYTSFFIFAGYILLVASCLFFIRCLQKDKLFALQFLKMIALTSVAVLIICGPALISYLDFLPYYHRGSGTTLSNAQVNPFQAENLLSYLFPPASYKLNTFNDISSRNAYIGIAPLLFVIYSFRFRMTLPQKFIILITIISFLFSLGSATPVRALFYKVLPFMDTFRHPGTIRIFTTMGLLVLSGFGWKWFLSGTSYLFMKRISYVALFLFLFISTYFIFFSAAIMEIKEFFESGFTRNDFRTFMEKSSLATWILISGCVQILFLLLLLVQRNKHRLPALSVTNMIIITFLCMPFTMVSHYSPKEVNTFLHSFPGGFPSDALLHPVTDRVDDPSTLTKFGYIDFYTKKISLQDHLLSPTVNSDYYAMLVDTVLRKKISSHPFIYDSLNNNILISAFSPNALAFVYEGQQPAQIMITQQYNHNWRAWSGDSLLKIRKSSTAFMTTQVPAGPVTIRLQYKPMGVIIAGVVSLLFIIGCLTYLIYFRVTKQ